MGVDVGRDLHTLRIPGTYVELLCMYALES